MSGRPTQTRAATQVLQLAEQRGYIHPTLSGELRLQLDRGAAPESILQSLAPELAPAALQELSRAYQAALSESVLPSQETAATLQVGQPLRRKIGPYDVERELARGGMGVVFLARHPQLKREVAVKLLTAGGQATEKQRERFAVEARTAARLRHPNITGIHEVGDTPEGPYLVMDYVRGGSLADLIEAEGPLEERRAAALIATLADALAYAHGQSILHRDIKPANVLIDAADGRPVLTDFGLAKEVDEEHGLTQTGQVLGTPAYMAPEQAAGQPERIDRRTDVYALGVTLYELLVGRLPFEAETALSLFQQIVGDEPPRPRKARPELDVDLETIVLTCLEKDPERRYDTAGELAADLRRFLADEPIEARRATALDRLGKWTKRNRTLAVAVSGVAALAVVSLLVITAVFLQRLAHERADLAEAQLAVDEARRKAALEHADALAQAARAKEAEERARKSARAAADEVKRAESLLAEALEARAIRYEETKRYRKAAAYFAAAALRQETPVRLARAWASARRAWKPVLTEASERPEAAAWSADGNQLAVSAAGNAVALIRDRKASFRLVGHRAKITLLRFSPDGSVLASGAADARVRLWRTRDGRPLAELKGHPRWIRALEWSPDGKLLASGCKGGPAKLWTADGKPVATLTGNGKTGAWSTQLTWAPDGRTLATSYLHNRVKGSSTRLWDRTGALVGLYPDHLRRLTWSPDGRRLLGIPHRRPPVVFEGSPRWPPTGPSRLPAPSRIEVAGAPLPPAARSPFRYLDWPEQGVFDLQWAPNGELIAGARSRGIRLVDAATGKKRGTLAAGRHLTHPRWSHDGLYLAAIGRGAVFVWNAATWNLEASFPADRSTRRFAWMPGVPSRIAVPDGEVVRLWTPQGHLIAALEHPGLVHALQWSPTAQRLLTLAQDGARLWQTSWVKGTGLMLRNNILSAGFAPDGRLAIRFQHTTEILGPLGRKVLARTKTQAVGGVAVSWSAGGSRLATPLDDPQKAASFGLLDGATYRPLFAIGRGGFEGYRWAPRSERIAYLRNDRVQTKPREWAWSARLFVLDAAGKQERALHAPTGVFLLKDTLCWSPDESRIAIAGSRFVFEPGPDGSRLTALYVWDVQRGKLTLELPAAQTHRELRVDWSAAADVIATAGERGVLKLWDPTRGRCLRTIQAGPKTTPGVLTWSPDGALLAWRASRGEVQLLNPKGDVQARFPCPPEAGVVWSPDGRLAVGGATMIVLRSRTGALLEQLSDQATRFMTWSRDGARLLAYGFQISPRILDARPWQGSVNDLIKVVEDRTGLDPRAIR